VLVASAGNANSVAPSYPAAYPEVIAVAATDNIDRKAAFSNFGSHIFVSAPGVNIISAYPGNSYGISSGTSFAAPIVTGQAALIRSLQLSGVELRIGATAVGIDHLNPGYAGKLGLGRVHIRNGVRAAKEQNR
jgi:subtilisin family serine protease